MCTCARHLSDLMSRNAFLRSMMKSISLPVLEAGLAGKDLLSDSCKSRLRKSM